MKTEQLINLISGSGTPSQRAFNAGCLVALFFCVLSAIESSLVGLSSYLVITNVLYSLILLFIYYLSRFKNKHRLSRFLGIVLLIFMYIPALWFLNGGSASGIPYFIVMFTSFIVVLSIDENNIKKRGRIFSVVILSIEIIIVMILMYAEYKVPGMIYIFPDNASKYIDMMAGMLIAVLGNYFILYSFVVQHYKDLEEIKKYSSMLEGLVQMDAMTGLLNHSHLLKQLDMELKKSSRYNRKLSLIMIDLDHFKLVNDTYGHQFGDEVLIAVAAEIKKCTRETDIAARYGGEEFIVVLPETDEESAVRVSTRIQECLKGLSLSRAVKITVSGGIAQCRKDETALEIMERADILLYKAKSNGRNCFETENLLET